ncbi:MAG: hypothetical protein PHE59_00160 [Patescibacteria group bacterium]|nr:hypothetical protein [Patescibacteria group bacterium]MDD5164584.1 hypothetical protein [Patescibacteria group bacterium]MDD5534339.1 hypothetical protein [Patescibacteria group bacterium]
MKRKNFLFLIVLIFILGMTSGCLNINFATPKANSGIFKSVNRAESWQQKVGLLVLSTAKKDPKVMTDLDAVDVSAMVLDPQDSNTLYLGTKGSGLFVSYDNAETWQKYSKLPSGKINAIAVHPKLKNVVYTAIGNRIFKSLDCCRTWENVYLEAAGGVQINALAVDPETNTRIYAGLSDGRLIRSEDDGLSWQTFVDLKGGIKQILINPNNPQIIYATTSGQGIMRTEDKGIKWVSLDESLKDFKNGRDVNKIIFDPRRADGIITASNYGLLRSEDGGKTWVDYKLLPKQGQASILSFAINPQNPNNIYYITANTLQKSADDGKTWVTKSLPSGQIPVELLVDPNNPNILYLGEVQKPKK